MHIYIYTHIYTHTHTHTHADTHMHTHTFTCMHVCISHKCNTYIQACPPSSSSRNPARRSPGQMPACWPQHCCTQTSDSDSGSGSTQVKYADSEHDILLLKCLLTVSTTVASLKKHGLTLDQVNQIRKKNIRWENTALACAWVTCERLRAQKQS